jgi:hypothetical protein
MLPGSTCMHTHLNGEHVLSDVISNLEDATHLSRCCRCRHRAVYTGLAVGHRWHLHIKGNQDWHLYTARDTTKQSNEGKVKSEGRQTGQQLLATAGTSTSNATSIGTCITHQETRQGTAMRWTVNNRSNIDWTTAVGHCCHLHIRCNQDGHLHNTPTRQDKLCLKAQQYESQSFQVHIDRTTPEQLRIVAVAGPAHTILNSCTLLNCGPSSLLRQSNKMLTSW